MMNRKYLRVILAVLTACLLGTAASQAKTNKKAEQLFKEGQTAELKNDWDTAVDKYQKAADIDPGNPGYEIAMRRARFEGGQKHVGVGVKLRGDNKLQEAMEEFKKALIMDPGSEVALQEIKRTQQLLLDRQKKGETAPGTEGLTETETMRREENQRVASLEPPPELKNGTKKLPTPMKMGGATPTMMFRTVAAEAGLYVSFDPAGLSSNKPMDVNLDGMPVETALDYLAFVTHTFWKPISANTIFVADDNTQKRRDFQTEAVRVFYLPNAGSVQEFQELGNAVRTIAEIRRVFLYNAGRAVIVRGTPDEIAFVEKLVHDLDKPKSEVIVDVMIMETNSSYSRQLAATIASGGTAGLNVPIAFTPTNAITTTTGSTSTTTSTTTTTTPVTTTGTSSTPSGSSSVALNSLAHLSTSDFSTSLPGALINAMLTDNRTKVLNRPQVRATDGQKVELQVGLRIPYATGSLGSAVGATTVGVSPLVQTQFAYADTGVTLIVQPTVHSADELSMHVEVTVAEVQQYEQLGGGISQPVISQEKSISDVRMRNGEVSLLGGLSQNTDSNNLSGIPGLTNIPVLGKFLFGSTSNQKMSDQILIALTPHIVRTPDYSPENLRTVYAGSDQNIRMVREQLPDAEPVILPPAPPKTEPAKPTAGTPAGVVPAPAPAPATPAPAPTAPAAAAANVPAAPGIPAAPAGPPAKLNFLPGPVIVNKEGSFTLTVNVEGASDVYSVTPLTIKYDPALVQLNDTSAGDLLLGNGVRVDKRQDIHNDKGEATLTLTRLPGSPGVTGAGALATLSFSAVGKGKGTVSITGASLKNSQLQPVPAELATVPVTVE